MKVISKTILAYMEQCFGVYVNPQQVEFSLRPDRSVCVVAGWPDTVLDQDYSLALVLECNSLEELINITGINRVVQFHDLTPHRLKALYSEGKATVSCVVDDPDFYYELTFFKNEAALWARDNNNEEHFVPTPPETPFAFFRHLRQHARSKMILL
jgi:hypothetical protein